MGQSVATFKGHNKDNENGGDDVRRQVDSGESDKRAIYQLVDVSTGGGKLIELIKSSARRQSCSFNVSSGSTESQGAALKQQHDHDSLDEQIRQLVEPLLYNGGCGQLVALRDLWRARFGQYPSGDDELDKDGERRMVCWRLDERGFVGETALHICFLLTTPSHMILAHKLLELFPMLIYDIYTCDEFFGESCLHMAIVHENIKIVKWLLDKGAPVHERCLGNFFLPLDQKQAGTTNARAKRILSANNSSGDNNNQNINEHEPDFMSNEFDLTETNYDGYCYWGEYPLSFTASLGLTDCYRLLLAKGADPDRRDSNGNTTLHICVITNRLDMFDLCYSNGAKLDLVNFQQLNPLALAAKLERVDMFFHILAIRCQAGWIMCQVCFQQIPLAGLDSIDTHDGSFDEHSLLCIVVSGASNAHLSMLDGLLAELLQVKWHTTIGHKFNAWFRCYMLFVLVASMAYASRLIGTVGIGIDLNVKHLRPIIDRARMLSESLLVAFVLYYLACLARPVLEAKHSGLPKRMRQLLAEAPELTMFAFTCLLILLCIPLRLAHLVEAESALAASIMFLLPLKLLFFCRASRSLGSFIVMIYKILVNDVLCFVVFLIIFVAGFSQSFLIIFKTHQSSKQYLITNDTTAQTPNKNYFFNLFDGLISMHMMALNEFSLVVDEFDETDFPLLARILFCFYMVLVSILLINMLIAMLGKTYQDISSQPNESLRQWARALLTVERMCSSKSRLKMLDKYSHKADHQGQRFYNSTWPLQEKKIDEIKLVKQLRQENQANSTRLTNKIIKLN